jgi:hypothetical protein
MIRGAKTFEPSNSSWGKNSSKACFALEKFKTNCKAEEKRCGRCKKIFLSKMWIYSILSGLFSINFIDLVIAGPTIAGYHIWLAIAYFSRARIWWNFNAGFITIPVTSLLMGLTIYARIGIVGALIYRWWNYKRICHKPPVNFTTLED